MNTQEKLQHLFDAALRSLDEPLPKPVSAAPENMFAPPPWRVREESATPTQPLPQPKQES